MDSAEKKQVSSVSESPAKGLFSGELRTDAIVPFPSIEEAEQETLRFVIESIDKFMGDRDDDFRRFDSDGEQPEEYLAELRELGLFSLIIPQEYDGLGLSNSGYSRILQQTSRYDGSTSLTIGAHSSIGMKALLLFGTSAQKEKYLSRLATGELIAAFCLTESGSGSDAASIKTEAKKNPDGTYTLNGEKIWITNGGTAGFFTVFAKTSGDKGKMSAFIVERDWEGVSVGPKEDKMGIRASCTTTVRFDNVTVPADALLGQEGKGFKVAMAVLNNGRTGLGGGCVGAMKRLIELAVAQSTQRKQFGKPINEFQLIQEKLALMTTVCFATESIVSVVGHLIDAESDDFSVEAAMSKVFASEALWLVADEALQISGGNGFMREFPYERVVRDCRINRIFEGTNEILRLFIALSGLKEPGEALKGVAKSLQGIFNDPIKGFGVLSDYASRKVGQFTTLGRPRMQGISPQLRTEVRILEQGVLKLGEAVESMLRRHGKSIIGQQLVTKRLADIATDLFVGMCVLSRVSSYISEKGEGGATAEIELAKIYTQMARVRITNNFRGLFSNADKQIIGLADYIKEAGGYPWDTI
jgi:alkylation response protein AidB-like acyl-CoA dehydrogenase